MKTLGNIKTHELESFNDDEILNEDWIPLRKEDSPTISSEQKVIPKLVWTDTEVVRAWDIIELTPEEITISKRKKFTSQDFLNRFTQEEMLGIIVASRNDPILELAKLNLGSATSVINDDPQTLQFMGYLLSTNHLTPERYNVIMGLD